MKPAWVSMIGGRTVGSLLFGALVLLAAGYVGGGLAEEEYLPVFLFVLLPFCGVVFLRPQIGLYLFCITLVLVPFDWRIQGFEPASPNAMLLGAAVAGWLARLATGRDTLRWSPLYVPFSLVVAVAWVNFYRYGFGFFNVPLILTESFAVFVLAFHLIRSRRHLYLLLTVLTLAFLIRSSVDLGVTVQSLAAGSRYGAIRMDSLLFFDATATTGSGLRGLVLPVFLAGALLFPARKLRLLSGVTALVHVAWLALAATRTGVLVLVAACGAVFVLVPGGERRRLRRWLVPVGIGTVLLMTVFTDAGMHVVWKTATQELQGGGRISMWTNAAGAFLSSPLWGAGMGVSHSYLLGYARTMGLLFLVPLGYLLWRVWRHGAWIRRQPLGRMERCFIVGVQAMFLVGLVEMGAATAFRTYPAFFFWLLIGAQEAGYEAMKQRVRRVGSPLRDRAGDPAG